VKWPGATTSADAWAESVGEERFAALRSTLVDMLERGLPEPQPPV
jgi:hypothetical protein